MRFRGCQDQGRTSQELTRAPGQCEPGGVAERRAHKRTLNGRLKPIPSRHPLGPLGAGTLTAYGVTQ